MHIDGPDQVHVHCPHCHADFAAPKSMAGGRANCPECRRAVEVPGGPDMLFLSLVLLGAFLVFGISAIVFLAEGIGAAAVAFVIGALVLTGICLAS